MYESELVLGAVIGAWILYELYGRAAIDIIGAWSNYIRIGGGIAVIGYLYWQMRDRPAEFKDTLDLAKQLMKRGHDLENRDQHGLTPLLRAAQQGNLTVVQALVGLGASIEAVDDTGNNALIAQNHLSAGVHHAVEHAVFDNDIALRH